MLYFQNRKKAREFKAKNINYKVVDMGTSSPIGRRWAVRVLNR